MEDSLFRLAVRVGLEDHLPGPGCGAGQRMHADEQGVVHAIERDGFADFRVDHLGRAEHLRRMAAQRRRLIEPPDLLCRRRQGAQRAQGQHEAGCSHSDADSDSEGPQPACARWAGRPQVHAATAIRAWRAFSMPSSVAHNARAASSPDARAASISSGWAASSAARALRHTRAWCTSAVVCTVK